MPVDLHDLGAFVFEIPDAPEIADTAFQTFSQRHIRSHPVLRIFEHHILIRRAAGDRSDLTVQDAGNSDDASNFSTLVVPPA